MTDQTKILQSFLIDIEEYLSQRADGEYTPDGGCHGNEEMRLLVALRGFDLQAALASRAVVDIEDVVVPIKQDLRAVITASGAEGWAIGWDAAVKATKAAIKSMLAAGYEENHV